MAKQPGEGDVHFPTTHWTELAALARALATGDRQALGPLLQRYEGPLRAYLTRERRFEANEADDLLQGFFLSRFLTGDLLARADQHRGRFRTLVLTALNNFVASERRAGAAVKRAPERWVSADLEEQPSDAAPPSAVFEAEWAHQVLREVLERVRERCRQDGRDDLVGVLECRLLAEEPAPYDELVRRFGYQTPGQVSNAVRTARALYARALHEVLRLEARDEADVEELKGDLLAILGKARA
jgi:DNA-directed RNA polymerase specialized sigma24 family protein